MPPGIGASEDMVGPALPVYEPIGETISDVRDAKATRRFYRGPVVCCELDNCMIRDILACILCTHIISRVS
jgi:hypothetical protein